MGLMELASSSLVFVCAIWVVAVFTAVCNIRFAKNIRIFTDKYRKGMIRVSVQYYWGDEKKIVKGWVYRLAFDTLANNPASAPPYIKVYGYGDEETIVPNERVHLWKSLNDNYLSIAFASKDYL